jgi:DNA polymerase III alpha subunit
MLDWAADNGYTHAVDLPEKAGGTVGGMGREPARAWGQVITYKRIPTKKTKEAMAFVTLEDPTGLTELVFFPKAYARFGELITSGRPLVVEGKVENDRGGLTLTVGHAWTVRGVVVPKPVEEQVAGAGAA